MKFEKISKNLKHSSVVLYPLFKNVGEHNAVMAGLNNCSGDYVVIMDDDLQHSADSLLDLIKFGIKEKNNFDVVMYQITKKENGKNIFQIMKSQL